MSPPPPRPTSRVGRSVAAWVLGLLVVSLAAAGLAVGLGFADWDRLQKARSSGILGTQPTIPPELSGLVAEAETRCPEVPSRVRAAQIEIESGWQADAVSSAGALGIAQFMPNTWKQFGIDGNGDGRRDVWDPADAIHSAAHLNCVNRDLVSEVPGSPLHNILAAYNAGHGAVRKYNGIPPFPETEAYVEKVLDLASRMPIPS